MGVWVGMQRIFVDANRGLLTFTICDLLTFAMSTRSYDEVIVDAIFDPQILKHI